MMLSGTITAKTAAGNSYAEQPILGIYPKIWRIFKDNFHLMEKPMCLLCSKVLAADSTSSGKLKLHLEATHCKYVGKSKEFSQRKLDEFTKQKQTFKEMIHFPSNALLASYSVSYRIVKCKKPHIIAETLVLPAAIDMVKITFGEPHAKQL